LLSYGPSEILGLSSLLVKEVNGGNGSSASIRHDYGAGLRESIVE